MDPMMPRNDDERRLCVMLGAATNRETREIDGEEYAVNVVEGSDDTFLYNPFLDGTEALELLQIGGFTLTPNEESKSPDSDWFCVVNNKHAIPGPTPNFAICMAAYAFLSGQIEEKERREIIAPENKLILPGM